jgi:nucleoside phosphorylase
MTDVSDNEIALISALTCEASPIIEELNLRLFTRVASFSIYKGDNFTWIISGIGAENGAAAINYLMGHNPGVKKIINLGICGAVTGFQKQTIVTPSKIVDLKSEAVFYPEIAIKGGALGTIGTAEEPITSPISDIDFYDMESAAIFGSAVRYLPPSRIGILKVVSDNLTDLPQSKDEVSAIIRAQKNNLIEFIKTFAALPMVEPSLSPAEISMLDKIKTAARLTVIQERQLTANAFNFKHRGGDLSPVFSGFLAKISTLKGDSTSRDNFLKELTDVLNRT